MRNSEEPYHYIQNYNIQQVVLSFSGKLTQDIIVSLGEALREELVNRYESKYTNRVFAVFIEVLQNVLHYAFEPQEQYLANPYYFDRIWVVDESNGISIISSNSATKAQAEKLKGKCEFANNLNAEELKKEYLERRKAKVEPDGKGAGIGLFDIVRKSGNKLNYHFTSVGPNVEVFDLLVKVKAENGDIFENK